MLGFHEMNHTVRAWKLQESGTQKDCEVFLGEINLAGIVAVR
jgi:hypothetical protein